nr:nitrate reductase subunit alpha [Candidatus Pantoea persica]
MGHVILNEFHLKNHSDYFLNYALHYTDMPMLVLLEPREDGSFMPGRQLRAADLDGSRGEENTPQWKTVALS